MSAFAWGRAGRFMFIASGATVLACMALFHTPARPSSRPRAASPVMVSEEGPRVVDVPGDTGRRELSQEEREAAFVEQLRAELGIVPRTPEEERQALREEAMAALRGSAGAYEKRVAIFRLWNERMMDDEAVDAVLAVLRSGAADDGLVRQALHAMKDSSRADVSSVTQAYLVSSPSAAVRLAAAKALHFRPGADVTRTIATQVPLERDETTRGRLLHALQTRALSEPAARMALEELGRSGSDASLREAARVVLAQADSLAGILARRHR